MGRKSKQAGSGHLPLTNYERKLYGKPYGTITKRLNGHSQYTFGSCALSLQPAIDRPVATPSLGYIYETSAILEYLVTKTQQLKQDEKQYQHQLEQIQRQDALERQSVEKQKIQDFEDTQKNQLVAYKKQPPPSDVAGLKRKRLCDNDDDDDDDNAKSNPLKRTSFWLAEFQPELDTKPSLSTLPPPPPKRPPSPNSQQPLRRKDLIPLELIRSKDSKSSSLSTPVLCAISHKAIVTQPALALIPKSKKENDPIPAQVVLEKVYNDLNLQGKEKMICPVTGKKLAKILKLQQGGSSFATMDDSGRKLEATTYRPTMT